MPLPLKTLPIPEQWDCHNCGLCCRGAVVLLSDADLKQLRQQHWDRHPDLQGKKIYTRAGLLGGRLRLAHRDDGTCVFYNDANKHCRIHEEFGYDAKPLTCRMAPLQMVALEDFAYVTLRRFCPSAAADQGRRMKDHIDEYRRMVLANDAVPNPTLPPKITRRCRRPWKDVVAVADILNNFMLDEHYPLVRRLVHGLEFCSLLDQCRVKKLQASRLPELLSACQGAAVELAKPLFEDRVPPNPSAYRCFRQIALDYLRLHPDFRAETSWRERGRIVYAALAFARGKGPVPCFRMDFPPTTFSQLERPLGGLPAEVMSPLTRYFERAAVSLRYAVFKGRSWSLTDGFRALAMGFPVALWMLRFACGPRSPEAQDVVKTVMMLDRGETNASLVGWQHRWRMHSLMHDHQLSRLTAWYAR